MKANQIPGEIEWVTHQNVIFRIVRQSEMINKYFKGSGPHEIQGASVVKMNLMDAAQQAENLANILHDVYHLLSSADDEGNFLLRDVIHNLSTVCGGVDQLRQDLLAGFYEVRRKGP